MANGACQAISFDSRADAPIVMVLRYEITEGGQRLWASERIRGRGRDQDNAWEFDRQ